jgi:NAD(P)-dependent dehydrogenase (short-subunit alcohol dehydrogenase family)
MTTTSLQHESLVAIVTGATSGIGEATAKAFSSAGWRVLAVGRRQARLDRLGETEPAIAGFPMDICAEGAPSAIVDAAIQRFGRVDALVNNAGLTAMMSIAETTVAGIRELFELNVVAPSLLVRVAAPRLSEVGGTIVNVSSTYGHRPLPGAAHYAASKAALEQLTRSWAAELAIDGIRVNAVAPGPTASEALVAAGLSATEVEAIEAYEADRIPLRRRGRPDEIAPWIVRLADPVSTTFLTGQIVTVDGGLELT